MPMVIVVVMMLLVVLAVIGGAILTYFSVKLLVKLLAALFSISSLPRAVSKSLKESRQYGRAIMRIAQQYPPGPLHDRLYLTVKPVNEWLTNLTKLELGLQKLYDQRNLPRELRQTDFEITSIRRQMLMSSPAEEVYLRKLLDSKKHHLAALKELQTFQTQAELKIHKIASDLGTTHAEMLLVIARGDFNENRLHRLDRNLQEHLSGMRDILAAMDEMGYSGALG
jgi:hypothetical protein